MRRDLTSVSDDQTRPRNLQPMRNAVRRPYRKGGNARRGRKKDQPSDLPSRTESFSLLGTVSLTYENPPVEMSRHSTS